MATYEISSGNISFEILNANSTINITPPVPGANSLISTGNFVATNFLYANGVAVAAAAGTQGVTGSQGPIGIQGSQGTQGTQGLIGRGYISITSSTSVTIASVGNIMFLTDAANTDTAFGIGDYVRVANTANTSNFITGTITAYVGNTAYVEADGSGGSGTFAGWTFNATGIQGVQGTQGLQGTQGTQGLQGIIGTGYYDLTSASSVTISSSGNLSFTTNVANTLTAFGVGSYVRVANTANTSNYVTGTIIEFNGSVANIAVDGSGGSGTFAGWSFNATGIQGVQGTQGIQGLQGTTGIQGTQGLQGTQGTQGTQGGTGDTSLINATAQSTGSTYYPVFVGTTGTDATAFARTAATAFSFDAANSLLSVGSVSTTGNITGNFFLGNGSQLSGIITSVSNINLGTTIMEVVSSGGNIRANIGGTANVQVIASTGVFVTGVVSASGNIDGANLQTGGLISATGNVTGNFFLGNGSQLTGIDATSIQSGTSNVRVVSSGGNVSAGIGGTANVLVIASTGTFVTGLSSVTGNIDSGNLHTAGVVSAAGNILGATISLSGDIVDSGALTISTGSNGNLTLTPNGTGVIIASRDILNGQANGTGNIGNATGYFDTIFAKATSAQYADLAEMFSADAEYAPGTVVVFGGTQEVTLATQAADTRVAGVISTAPSYLMNAGISAANRAIIALQGRVPVQVIGPVTKGALLVSAPDGRARAMTNPPVGSVIGKSLVDFDGDLGTIEMVVGRD